SFGVIFHFHEAESTRAACLTVHDHLRPRDLAVFLKQVVQVVLRGIPYQVADINVLSHLKTFPSKPNKRAHQPHMQCTCESSSYTVDRQPLASAAAVLAPGPLQHSRTRSNHPSSSPVGLCQPWQVEIIPPRSSRGAGSTRPFKIFSEWQTQGG